jgi:hypothetical protein
MSTYALVAMQGVHDGRMYEATREFEDLDGVFDAIREVVEGPYRWQAITLIHIEDLPAVLSDSRPEPG